MGRTSIRKFTAFSVWTGSVVRPYTHSYAHDHANSGAYIYVHPYAHRCGDR